MERKIGNDEGSIYLLGRGKIVRTSGTYSGYAPYKEELGVSPCTIRMQLITGSSLTCLILTLTLCVTNKNPKSSHFFFLLQIPDMMSYPDYCGVACGDIGAGLSQKPEKL